MRTPEKILRQSLPTDGLEAAIEAFRYPAPARRAASWPTLAGLATALAVGILALRLSAPAAEASPLARMAWAEKDAFHYDVTLRDDKGRIWLRFWREGAKSRMTFNPAGPSRRETGFDGKRTWSIAGESGVSIIQSGLRPFRPPLQKIEEYRGKIIRNEKDADGSRTVVIQRAASRTSLLQRDTIVTDPSDRPIRIVHEYFRNGRWTLGGSEIRDYKASIAPGTFEFRPPKGFEVYDIDANRARLRKALREGPTRRIGDTSVRFVGVLQQRSGRIAAVYSGGVAPLPDASAYVERDRKRYPGVALVPSSDAAPRLGQAAAIDRSPSAQPVPSRRPTWKLGEQPYAVLEGVPLHVVEFDLPKILGNPARPLRIALPVVAAGRSRAVDTSTVTYRGIGLPRGVATFDDVVPIRSNMAEEIAALPGTAKYRMEVPLRKSIGSIR